MKKSIVCCARWKKSSKKKMAKIQRENESVASARKTMLRKRFSSWIHQFKCAHQTLCSLFLTLTLIWTHIYSLSLIRIFSLQHKRFHFVASGHSVKICNHKLNQQQTHKWMRWVYFRWLSSFVLTEFSNTSTTWNDQKEFVVSPQSDKISNLMRVISPYVWRKTYLLWILLR